MADDTPNWHATYPGRVVTLSVAAGFDGGSAALEQFGMALARSAARTRQVRVMASLGAVVALAFIASRVEAPVGVGLCGLLVVAPAVWLLSGLLVPLAVLQRNLPTGSGHLAFQSGVPIAFETTGLSAGPMRAPWSAVRWVGHERDAAVIRGHDAAAGLLFEVSVSIGVLGGIEARDALIRAVQARLPAKT